MRIIIAFGYAFTALAVTLSCSVAACWLTNEEKNSKIGTVVGIVLSIILLFYLNTASGGRLIKSFQSNVDNGVQREVKVYDINGKLIKEYHGKFDVKYDDNRILFDDEQGRRHMVYYPTGTVIIDEVAD